MSYGAARPVLEKVVTEEKATADSAMGAENWLAWVRESDSQVRQRLEGGRRGQS